MAEPTTLAMKLKVFGLAQSFPSRSCAGSLLPSVDAGKAVSELTGNKGGDCCGLHHWLVEVGSPYGHPVFRGPPCPEGLKLGVV